MGTQQVLRAAAAVALTCVATASVAAPVAQVNDHVAVIDLGPGDQRAKVVASLVAHNLERISGDGVEDALAGQALDRDAIELAGALADAQAKFGALQCKETLVAAQNAIAIAAARQAAGIAVPELPRAWTYVLLCADRGGDVTTAVNAATELRALGATADVDATVLARYPEVDALSNRETVPLEIQTEVAGADVWVDFQRVGTSPVKLVLTSGTHVIAAASGSRRGVLTGTVIRKQPLVTVPMPEQASGRSALAQRVAGWGGKVPTTAELDAVLTEVGARVAVIRHGDTVEAWGHAGGGEPLRRLGDNDDGIRPLAEIDALVALVADRIGTWNSRAPDPDQPLLTETPEERQRYNARGERVEPPTPWWVYVTIGSAVLVGAVVIYAHESADNTQRVELHYPGLRF